MNRRDTLFDLLNLSPYQRRRLMSGRYDIGRVSVCDGVLCVRRRGIIGMFARTEFIPRNDD